MYLLKDESTKNNTFIFDNLSYHQTILFWLKWTSPKTRQVISQAFNLKQLSTLYLITIKLDVLSCKSCVFSNEYIF